MYIFLYKKINLWLFIKEKGEGFMRCLLCKKPLEKNEIDFCEDCLEFLKHKYAYDQNFERRLQCYKKLIQELQED